LQDYDDEQLSVIKSEYACDNSKLPCFFEMPFERTLGLNVFGKETFELGKETGPLMDDTMNYYVGKRINVKVGQLLVMSCFVWHATALPCPIFSKKLKSGDATVHKFDEYWVTNSDDRLHFYFGCREGDVDDVNLYVPKTEEGMHLKTEYVVAEVGGFSNASVLKYSQVLFKAKQIQKG
jgi:hypothetical protein